MNEPLATVRVLFVCLGNICRSPMAEGIFRKLVADLEIEHRFEIDSAGTGDWHLGEPIDARAERTLRAYESDFYHTARQVTKQDFEYYDYILAMDAANERDLLAICPTHQRDKIYRVMKPIDNSEVPDPYYSNGSQGFELVYQMLRQSLVLWLERWVEEKGIR